jgi:hypothetical protein
VIGIVYFSADYFHSQLVERLAVGTWTLFLADLCVYLPNITSLCISVSSTGPFKKRVIAMSN